MSTDPDLLFVRTTKTGLMRLMEVEDIERSNHRRPSRRRYELCDQAKLHCQGRH